MATKTWQNGVSTHNWSDALNWAEGSKPAAGDDVVMSAAWDCIVDEATANLKSFNMTGYSNTLSGSNNINVAPSSGPVTCLFAGTISWTGTLYLRPASSVTINFTSGGKTLQAINANLASTGIISQQDGLTLSGEFRLQGGTWNTNNNTITTFNVAVLNSPTFSVGTSSFSVVSIWAVSSTTTLSYSAGFSITFTYTGEGITLDGGGLTYYNISRTGVSTVSDSISINSDFTIGVGGTLTLHGNSSTNRLLIASNTLGTSRIITCNGSLDITNADFRDISGAGTASWNLSAITGLSGDCGGNSNITFTGTTAQHWTNTNGGTWSTSGNWTSRVPLPQDTLLMDCSFLAGKTVNADMPRLGKNIDWTGAANSPIFNTSLSSSQTFYGSITLISAMNLTGSYFWTVHNYGGSCSITSNTKTLPSGLQIYNFSSGSYSVIDNLNTGGAFNCSGGTLTLTNRTITCTSTSFGSSVSIGMASTTFNVSTGSGWSASGATFSAYSGSVINMTNTGAGTQSFAGGTGNIYNNLVITGGAGSGSLTFFGSSSFNNFTINAPKTIIIANGVTQTITGIFTAIGTAVNAINISSQTASTKAYITLTHPYDNVAYVVATDIDSSGGNQIYDPNGTLTRTVNWLTDSSSSSSASSSSSSRSSSSRSSSSSSSSSSCRSSSSSSSSSLSSSSSSCRSSSSSSSSSSKSSSSSSCRSSSSSSSSCRSSSSSCRSSSSSSSSCRSSSSSCRSSSSSSSSCRSSSSSSSSCRSSSSSSSCRSSSSSCRSSSSSSSCRSSSSSLSSSSLSSSSSSSSSCRSSSSSSSSSSRSSSSSSSSSSLSSSSSSSSSSVSSSSSSSSSSLSSSSSSSSSSVSSSSSSLSSSSSSNLNVTKDYSQEELVSLPLGYSDLSHLFTAQEYADVAILDDVFVDQTIINNGYPVFLWKNKSLNNTLSIPPTWVGKTSIAPSTAKVVLQIYNHNTDLWEDVAENSTANANEVFTLSGFINSNLSYYYDVDNWVYCRVYQDTIPQ